MASALSRYVHAAFLPPRYLTLPTLGIDLSTSGAKAVLLSEHAHGLELAGFTDVRFPSSAFTGGDMVDRAAIVKGLTQIRKTFGIKIADLSLPESKAYLFETKVPGETKAEWRTAVEQHIDEYVPLPPAETAFDLVSTGVTPEGTGVAGVAYARRIIEEILDVCDEAGLTIRALENESFAAARSLLPQGDTSTVLIIDIGKTTTKLSIVSKRVPLFATTIEIGGHSLTLAVQKHFGVTETEARRVKLMHGIVPGEGNEDYLAAMLSTASAIRDEITHKLDYWQAHVAISGGHDAVSKAFIVGGNASVRGLAEYLEGALRVPVTTGNVFANFASRDTWMPALDYTQSLVFSTAIGLALRDYVS